MRLALHAITLPAAVAALLASDILPSIAAEGDPGEFSIRAVTPLDAAQLAALRRLVAGDAEAAALAETSREEAQGPLASTPDPLEVIHYEGLLNTDPRRVASVDKLRQMDDAAALMRYWQVSGDKSAAAKLREFILSWASAYKPTGNDVNENKLYPLLVAYAALRDSFSPEDKGRVDAWVENMGRRHLKAVREADHYSNRYAKSLRLATIGGIILDRPEWREAARDGLRRFVATSLRADGSSSDLERRDSLTYHMSSLKPLLELALLSGDGVAIYTWEAEGGGSIKRSVDFVVPYATGEKTRREWVNSQIGLDHRRAEAGIAHYQPGSLFEPKQALELMEQASVFDPALMPVVVELAETRSQRIPTWHVLTNQAVRDARAAR